MFLCTMANIDLENTALFWLNNYFSLDLHYVLIYVKAKAMLET